MFSNKEYNFSKNFSDNQVFQIVKLRESSDQDWPSLAEILNKRWMKNYSSSVYYGIYRRFADEVKRLHEEKSKPRPHQDFTREALGNPKSVNKVKTKRFFLTAIGLGQPLHKEGFKAILSFCEKKKAKLILLPMRAHVRAMEDQPNYYDPELKAYKNCIYTEYVLNSRLKALELQINPQQVNPLTGLHRIRGRTEESYDKEIVEYRDMITRQKKQSIIVAHSKQLMEVFATGNDSYPRIIHSTGAITRPNYLLDRRIGHIATEDHDLGGLIIEVNGDEFYPRQVQINPANGSFVDLGERFKADGTVVKEAAEGFVMGDIHPGHESDEALGVWHEIWGYTNPKKIFLHDWLDGTSNSPHLEKRKYSNAVRPSPFKDIPTELEYAKKVLYEKVADKAPKGSKLYLVPSNHPDFTERYIESGRYINDCAENYKIAHRFVVEKLDGKDPLRSRLDPDNRFEWPAREDDIIVEGVQCNAHGDMAADGVKGSPMALEKTYSAAMTAHSHKPGITHELFSVGHSSEDRHGYNRGASSWIKCSGLIYKGGHRQLIMVINGRYRI